MVNLNDSAILETFKSKKESKKESKKKSKKESKKKSANKVTGKKANSNDNNDSIEQFTSKINDSNLKNYSDKFMKSESKSNISLFKAANEEYGDQNYQKFV